MTSINCNHENSWIQFRICPQCNKETLMQTIKDIKEQARKEAIEECISKFSERKGKWLTFDEIRALLEKK